MENIAEAQHDQSIISTSSSHNIHHSTSVSQDPIFNAQIADTSNDQQHTDDLDQDVSGCRLTALCSENVFENGFLFCFPGFERKESGIFVRKRARKGR